QETAAADGREARRGDGRAVERDGADVGLRDDQVDVVDVEGEVVVVGEGVGAGVGVHGRHDHHRGVAGAVVEVLAVRILHHFDGLVGGDVGGRGQVGLEELPVVESGHHRAVDADVGAVGAGQDADQVAAAARGKGHGFNLRPPAVDRQQFLQQRVAGV